MPRTTTPIERRKKLLEEFKRQRTFNNKFEPIKRFTNERAVSEFDKWYSSTMGGTKFEK